MDFPCELPHKTTQEAARESGKLIRFPVSLSLSGDSLASFGAEVVACYLDRERW